MRKMFTFECKECGKTHEKLIDLAKDALPVCPDNSEHGAMQKKITAPAFTFVNGQGTSGGHTWR